MKDYPSDDEYSLYGMINLVDYGISGVYNREARN